MSVKYVTIKDKKQTIAILSDTKYDAVHRIDKLCGRNRLCAIVFNTDVEKYYMPNQFKTTVTCVGDDVFDVEEGKRIAKEKLMRNYRNSLNKRIVKFKLDLLDMCAEVFKEDWEKLENE